MSSHYFTLAVFSIVSAFVLSSASAIAVPQQAQPANQIRVRDMQGDILHNVLTGLTTPSNDAQPRSQSDDAGASDDQGQGKQYNPDEPRDVYLARARPVKRTLQRRVGSRRAEVLSQKKLTAVVDVVVHDVAQAVAVAQVGGGRGLHGLA